MQFLYNWLSKSTEKKINKKSKRTHFASFFDCAALQDIDTSDPKEQRRKMRRMKKVVLRTFRKSPKRMKKIHQKNQNGPTLPVCSAFLLCNFCLHL